MKVPLCSIGLRPHQGRCPATPHTNSQSCKAGQRVSLTTYCPWATCSNRCLIVTTAAGSADHRDLLVVVGSKSEHVRDTAGRNQDSGQPNLDRKVGTWQSLPTHHQRTQNDQIPRWKRYDKWNNIPNFSRTFEPSLTSCYAPHS